MKVVLYNSKIEVKKFQLPTTWDYEVLCFAQGLTEATTAFSAVRPYNYVVTTPANTNTISIKAANSGNDTTATPVSGTIIKMSDTLFAKYDGSKWNPITANSNKINLQFVSGAYIYTSPATIELQTNLSNSCVSVPVQAGDVLVYSCKGGNTSRAMMIKSTGGTMEIVLDSNSGHYVTSIYEVKNDGTLYLNNDLSAIASPSAYILRAQVVSTPN